MWINNAGLDGHSTFGHQILLRTLIAPLKPQIVLFLVGVNDIERDDLNSYDQSASQAKGGSTPQSSLLQIVMDHSFAASFVRNLPRVTRARQVQVAHADLDFAKIPLATPMPEAARIALRRSIQARYLMSYRGRLRSLIQICREYRITPIFITQPALYGPGRDPITGVDLGRITVQPARGGQMAWEVLDLYNQATREIAKEEDILLIDLAAKMPRSSRYFYDFIHFTREGAKVVAQILVPELLPHAKKILL